MGLFISAFRGGDCVRVSPTKIAGAGLSHEVLMKIGIRAKKITANILIGFFAILLLAATGHRGQSNATMTQTPGGLGAALGDFFPLAGIVLSIYWRVKLAGNGRTAGRQAITFLLIGSFGIGVLIIPGVFTMATDRTTRILALVMGLFWAVALYACIWWLKRLRRRESDSRHRATMSL